MPAPMPTLSRSPGSDAPVQDPPFSVVSPGDPAPDFSYEARDHQWRRLRDLLVHGDVLLVFGADDEGLRALETEREALLAHGVVPIAVLDLKDHATWTTPDRLQLHYGVVPDSRSVIAEQFNLLNPETGRAYPSWFLVDHAGKVRALHRGALPSQGFTAIAERALGKPRDDQPLPANAR